jgi:hypothetical protein
VPTLQALYLEFPALEATRGSGSRGGRSGSGTRCAGGSDEETFQCGRGGVERVLELGGLDVSRRGAGPPRRLRGEFLLRPLVRDGVVGGWQTTRFL